MKALLLIDIQNDFLPDGALAVANGNEVIEVANRLMSDYDLVVATQDWHPAGHESFASQHDGKQVGDIVVLNGLDQIMWPDHCVQNSEGAKFSAELNTTGIHRIIQKGTDRKIDSYSGFFDNARRKATGLEEYLRKNKVEEVHLVGLATDYCVKFTALDAVDLGFRTVVIQEGVRGVDLQSGDCERSIKEMQNKGISIA